MENKIIAKRSFIGTVISAKMDKTVVAEVVAMKMNAKYRKKYRVSKKFHVHDEKGEAQLGDVIKFVECRPLSKTKRWRLVEIIKK